RNVTGVQTCALPILLAELGSRHDENRGDDCEEGPRLAGQAVGLVLHGLSRGLRGHDNSGKSFRGSLRITLRPAVRRPWKPWTTMRRPMSLTEATSERSNTTRSASFSS